MIAATAGSSTSRTAPTMCAVDMRLPLSAALRAAVDKAFFVAGANRGR